MAATKQPSTLGSRELADRQAAGMDDATAPRDERSVIKHFQSFLKSNAPHCRAAWERSEENQKFASGGKHQWDEGAYDKRKNSKRPTFSFPDVELAVRALSGREMTARFEPTFLSRSPDDAPWTNLLREASRFIRQTGGAENVETDAFRDLTIDDYSVVSKGIVYDGDEPHGRIDFEHPPLWEHVWDRTASKVCFTDRSADARGYYVSIDDFLMSYPEQAEKIQARVGSKGSWVTESTRAEYRHPWSAFSERRQFYRREENQVFLVSYHWRQREAAYLATVPAGLDPHPVGPEAWAQLTQVLGPAGIQPGMLVADPQTWQQFRPILEQAAAAKLIDPGLAQLARPRLIKMDEQTFGEFSEAYAQALGAPPDALKPEDGSFRWARFEAIIVGDDVIRQRRLPYRHFPRIYMTAVPFKQISGTTMQSVVDTMKDPQRFKNFVTSIMSTHLQRSQKMGVIYPPNYFEDENDVESRMSEPFFVLRRRVGTRKEDLDFVEGAGFPHGADKFLELADAAAWRGTGLNPNTLGNLQDPRRVSGTVFQALSDAVMTVQSWEFNALRTMKIISGELDLDMMAEHWDPDDLRDIVGPAKAALVPEKGLWKTKLKYDAITTEVPVSKSEKEQAWDFMSRQGTAEKGITGGWMPPWMMVKMMPDGWLPEEDRQAWLNWLDQRGMGPNSPAPPPPGTVPPPQAAPGGAEPVQ